MTGLATDRRSRRLAVLALLLLAPTFAELLASYVDDTGDLGAGLFLIVFLAPLYGGACLLIREVALRTGRGWAGRLLLAAAFGIAMATLVDGSLWTRDRPDVEIWDEIVNAALLGDFSVYAAVSWVVGHVVISVGAPIALVEGLAPRIRDRLWIGVVPLAFITAAGIGVGLLIRYDEGTLHGSALETLLSVAATVLVVLAAFSPLGRPIRGRTDRKIPGAGVVAVCGFGAYLVLTLVPAGWPGVVVYVVGGVAAVVIVRRLAPSTSWTHVHIAALGWGALLAMACIGFLVPVPDGVAPAAKYGQNVVLLGLVAAAGLALRRVSSACVRSDRGDAP